MNSFIFCDNLSDTNSVVSVFEWIIPFLLGLFSSFIIDQFQNVVKRRKIKKFTLIYLEKNIIVELKQLKTEYSKVYEYIKAYPQERFTISAFESFNEKVLQVISPVEYYEIFKNEYVLLNEIISMIEFLRSNLPSKIMEEYFDFINNHLKEKNLIGDVEHVNTNCLTCKDKKDDVLVVLESRIKETQILNSKILKLIRNFG